MLAASTAAAALVPVVAAKAETEVLALDKYQSTYLLWKFYS